MAVALPYLSVALAGYSVYEENKAAGEMEDIAKDNANRQRLESEEAVRRLVLSQEQSEAQAKALAAGSGVQMEGSITDYIDLLSKTHKEEAAWLKQSGLSAASIMEREGEVRADAVRRGAYAKAGSTFLTTSAKAGWFE